MSKKFFFMVTLFFVLSVILNIFLYFFYSSSKTLIGDNEKLSILIVPHSTNCSTNMLSISSAYFLDSIKGKTIYSKHNNSYRLFTELVSVKFMGSFIIMEYDKKLINEIDVKNFLIQIKDQFYSHVSLSKNCDFEFDFILNYKKV